MFDSSIQCKRFTTDTTHKWICIGCIVFEGFNERTLSESYFSIQQCRFLLRCYGQNPFITERAAVYIATRHNLSVKSFCMWFSKRRVKQDWKCLYDFMIGIFWLCNDC